VKTKTKVILAMYVALLCIPVVNTFVLFGTLLFLFGATLYIIAK